MKKIKEICNQIKLNRENKKKSIDEVASILKIKTELLILIEAGKFQTIENNILNDSNAIYPEKVPRIVLHKI